MANKKRPKSYAMGFNYKGELATPIDSEFATTEYVSYQLNRNMVLLFRAMSIRHGDWKGLALALAAHHVPGFRVTSFEERSAGGRPEIFSSEYLIELACEIDKIIDENDRPGGKVQRTKVKGAYKYLMTLTGSDRFKKPDDRSEVAWLGRIQKLVSAGRALAKEPKVEATAFDLAAFMKGFQKHRHALFREKDTA